MQTIFDIFGTIPCADYHSSEVAVMSFSLVGNEQCMTTTSDAQLWTIKSNKSFTILGYTSQLAGSAMTHQWGTSSVETNNTMSQHPKLVTTTSKSQRSPNTSVQAESPEFSVENGHHLGVNLRSS